ncbi:ankyrin repeat domain-containing protein [Helicobacter typhlonius]|uniref:ankyrin repeat domain-containing protein n=1 Tax=Helicobacter typhlonius TaxID=76936 RepID=UPI002FE3079A
MKTLIVTSLIGVAIGIIQFLVVLGLTLNMETGGASGIPLVLSFLFGIPFCTAVGLVLGIFFQIIVSISSKQNPFNALKDYLVLIDSQKRLVILASYSPSNMSNLVQFTIENKKNENEKSENITTTMYQNGIWVRCDYKLSPSILKAALKLQTDMEDLQLQLKNPKKDTKSMQDSMPSLHLDSNNIESFTILSPNEKILNIIKNQQILPCIENNMNTTLQNSIYTLKAQYTSKVSIQIIKILLGVILFAILLFNGIKFYEKSNWSENALVNAVYENDIQRVEKLLKKGADINRNYTKPLIGSSYEYEKDFIKNNANALDVALYNQNTEILLLLLNSGQTPKIHETSIQSIVEVQNLPILQLLEEKNLLDIQNAYTLHSAMRKENAETARIVLSHATKELIHSSNLAYYATNNYNDDVEILALLVEYGIDINKADDKRNAPLLNTAKHHLINKMQFLLQNGADINVQNEYGDVIDNALYRFYKEKEKQKAKAILEILKSYGKVPTNDNISNAILSRESTFSTLERLKFFRSFGLEYNMDNLIAAVMAIKEYDTPRKELIEEVLNNSKLNLNMPDKNGDYPLHFIGEYYAKERVEFLHQKGANLNVQNHLGETILMKFLRTNTSDKGNIILYLLDNGADVNLKNKEGKTALDIFRESYKPNEYYQGYKERIKTRLEELSEK